MSLRFGLMVNIYLGIFTYSLLLHIMLPLLKTNASFFSLLRSSKKYLIADEIFVENPGVHRIT